MEERRRKSIPDPQRLGVCPLLKLDLILCRFYSKVCHLLLLLKVYFYSRLRKRSRHHYYCDCVEFDRLAL